MKNYNNNRFKLVPTILISSLMLSSIIGMNIYAQGNTTSNGKSSTSGNSNANQGATSGSENKLQGQSLEKCQNREVAMNNIMARIGDRSQKQINVIDSVYQKLQAYYSEKNLSISNYQEKVTNVESKKTLANTNMNTVRNMNGNFSCGNSDPKGTATQFKSQVSAHSDSVTQYKNAVYELVTLVKDNVMATEETL